MTDLELARKSGATWGNEADQLFMSEAALAAFTAAVRQEERERAEQDARRYRWLRDTLQSAIGGGVEVNDDRLVYQTPEPGEEVRLYWYPNTPVGFNEVKAATLDAAIDAAILAQPEQKR